MSKELKPLFLVGSGSARPPAWISGDSPNVRPLEFANVGDSPLAEDPATATAAASASEAAASSPPPGKGARATSLPPSGPRAAESLPPPGSTPAGSLLPPAPSHHSELGLPEGTVAEEALRQASMPPLSIAPGSGAHPEQRRAQEEFARAAIDLASARVQVLSHVEQQLLRLSSAIAGAIIEREVDCDEELHRTLAEAALSALGGSSTATLRASSEAYRVIHDFYGGTHVDVEDVRVHLIEDSGMQGLGCIVENNEGRLDGRLEERLRSVTRALDEERQRLQEEGSDREEQL